MLSNSNEMKSRLRLGSVFSSLFRLGMKRRSRSTEPDPVIVPTPEGFELRIGDETRWSVGWDSVVQVVAFKRDFVSTDLICVGFAHRDDSDRYWCIHEELDGFQAIAPAINALTHNALNEKWQDVMLPAFETNWTTVWTRSGESGPSDEDPLLIWRHAPEDSESVRN